jgi:hypothetical protein
MAKLTICFDTVEGRIKPMHAVNNGPQAPTVRGTSNYELYKEAGIPYARNHDASFYSDYGGEHTVDVHRIFKNFDADENDEASYSFESTDKYVGITVEAGTKVFYRLGASIEHGYKYGTYPPKDFNKWARICEHIIRHYTDGWANGFQHDIEYWEIWNEPDCNNADGSNPCWQGTEDQFIEFYSVVASHLKARFPHLKIGGPAMMSPRRNDFKRKFLYSIKSNNIPLDFYSYHKYCKTPYGIYEASVEATESLKEAGLENVETILNEWNYVKGWIGDDWKCSIDAWKGLKGASFILGSMCVGQHSPVDMMMFYEARPCVMCSLFETDRPWVPLKGYYSIKMFSELYALGNSATVSCDDNEIYAAAASNEENAAILLTYYADETEELCKKVVLDLSLFSGYENAQLEYYLLDKNHNCELVKKEAVIGSSVELSVELYSSYLIKIAKS